MLSVGLNFILATTIQMLSPLALVFLSTKPESRSHQLFFTHIPLRPHAERHEPLRQNRQLLLIRRPILFGSLNFNNAASIRISDSIT